MEGVNHALLKRTDLRAFAAEHGMAWHGMAHCLRVPEDGETVTLSPNQLLRSGSRANNAFIYAASAEATSQLTRAAVRNIETYHQGVQGHEA